MDITFGIVLLVCLCNVIPGSADILATNDLDSRRSSLQMLKYGQLKTKVNEPSRNPEQVNVFQPKRQISSVHTETRVIIGQKEEDLQSNPRLSAIFQEKRTNGPYIKKSHASFSKKETTYEKTHCTSASNCSCLRLRDGSFRANCTSMGLSFIPHFEPVVSEIYLDKNNIMAFPNISVFPKHLTLLILSSNRLTGFGNDPFRGLNDLKELDLNDNKFEYRSTIYKSHIFKDLTHLETLNLQQNNERSYNFYPTDITIIRTLKTLFLDGMDGASFHESYKNLSLLTSLHLGGKWSKEHILRSIKTTTFKNLPPIKHLDISFCNLHYIEKLSLRCLKSLQSLDISNNIVLTFRVLSNLSSDLQFTDIKSLKLDNIHCLTGVGTIIFAEDFKGLSNSSLTDISLKGNRLEFIEPEAIDILPKTLKNFDVSDNRLNNIFLLFMLFNLQSIEAINCSAQPLSRAIHDFNMFQHCSDWRGPGDRYNYIDSDSGYRKAMVSPWDFFIPVSPSLQHISANNLQNIGEFRISLTFSEPNNIRRIDLSHGSIITWYGGMKNLHNLTYLDLSDNTCTDLSEVFFMDFPSLEYLNIRNNFIGHMLSINDGYNIFGRLNRLEHFDISNIGLTNLSANFFVGLSKMKILNVSRNSITDWSAKIGHMTGLQYLDLKANRMRVFDSVTMNSIDAIAAMSSVKIDLSDNSLLCTCDTLSFLKWMNQKQTLFVKFGYYECVHNNSIVKFKDLVDILSSLEKNCARYSEVIAGVVVVILLVTVLIVCGIFYRYRWRIRYLYQMARKGLKPLNQADKLEFDFDGFMSYAEEDSNFVVKEALPVLEEQFGLKLRLHQRDFIPGKSIAANITHNIHKSRKTIAVVTSAFLRSYWCMFEFNIARMESVYSRGGEPTLVLVLLEDLQPRDLPLMMLDIIHSDSYLKVPEEKNEEFWANFRGAILMK